MSTPIQNNISTKPNLAQLKNGFDQELHNILNWWSTHMVDEQNGGFYGRMDGHGNLHAEADKGVILNTRLLWTYSAAAIATNLPRLKQMAHRAYDYIGRYFWDELEGGLFWSLDYQGNPVDTQKQIYAQAFAIYALSEYYSLTKNKEALDKATEIFWLIEKYSLDRKKGGYLSAFARNWSNMDDIRLSEKDANEAKIMNTHLHILEAYTNYYRLSPSIAIQDALRNCIELFFDHFYIPENGSMHIYFDENWMPKGEDISFGHNVEASWLLWEAAEVLGNDDLLKRVRPVCIQMAESVFHSAIDKDGALLYEADPNGIKDTDKHWWPQAEAVVGFWNAYEMTGEEKFAETAINCWHFIKKYLINKEHGEWHWRTDRSGIPILSENIAGSWKAPYHNTRMCLEMMRRLD